MASDRAIRDDGSPLASRVNDALAGRPVAAIARIRGRAKWDDTLVASGELAPAVTRLAAGVMEDRIITF